MMQGESELKNKTEIDPIWCATAKIKEETIFGEEHISKKGTKHFRGGAKIYIVSVYGGMCDDATVIGHHRSNGRYIKITMPVINLESFRLELVYSPKVIELIRKESEKKFVEYTKDYAEYLIVIIPEWIRDYYTYRENKLKNMTTKIPRNKENDYTREAADARRKFAKEHTNAALNHVGSYSIEPADLPGNIENFIGAAQIPIGLAGPLLVNGEHANGEFFVPLATTEGTLVASYNRGMKLLRESGGVTTTVVDDAMQRAPVFVFKSAREAQQFSVWVKENFAEIKAKAETTTSVGKLRDIQQFPAARFLYLRFNYTTGDAAGQNMVGKATKAACDWIKSVYEGIERYQLEGSFATDKKTSWVNTLNTRGKKVIAEATISAAKLQEIMHVSVERIFEARLASQLGGYLAGVNNNGAHSANGITAIFIACGQDVANVAESSAAAVYAEITKSGDYYFSVTIPSLIVATYGGGTGLPTQRECLELMDCYGAGKVKKFAEIIAATVLCGELSLGTAVIADEWVSSHENLGRNR